MHIDFVLPVNGSIAEGMRAYRGLAERACMDYGWHVAMTAWGEDVSRDMAAAVAAGVNSFKFFMAYKARCRLRPLTCLYMRCASAPRMHVEAGAYARHAQSRR